MPVTSKITFVGLILFPVALTSCFGSGPDSAQIRDKPIEKEILTENSQKIKPLPLAPLPPSPKNPKSDASEIKPEIQPEIQIVPQRNLEGAGSASNQDEHSQPDDNDPVHKDFNRLYKSYEEDLEEACNPCLNTGRYQNFTIFCTRLLKGDDKKLCDRFKDFNDHDVHDLTAGVGPVTNSFKGFSAPTTKDLKAGNPEKGYYELLDRLRRNSQKLADPKYKLLLGDLSESKKAERLRKITQEQSWEAEGMYCSPEVYKKHLPLASRAGDANVNVADPKADCPTCDKTDPTGTHAADNASDQTTKILEADLVHPKFGRVGSPITEVDIQQPSKQGPAFLMKPKIGLTRHVYFKPESVYYGAYCGPGHPPELAWDFDAPPMDCLDNCCRQHDYCYWEQKTDYHTETLLKAPKLLTKQPDKDRLAAQRQSQCDNVLYLCSKHCANTGKVCPQALENSSPIAVNFLRQAVTAWRKNPLTTAVKNTFNQDERTINQRLDAESGADTVEFENRFKNSYLHSLLRIFRLSGLHAPQETPTVFVMPPPYKKNPGDGGSPTLDADFFHPDEAIVKKATLDFNDTEKMNDLVFEKKTYP